MKKRRHSHGSALPIWQLELQQKRSQGAETAELKDEEKYGNQQIMSCLNKCYFSQIFNILVDRLKRADSGILDTLLVDTSS